MKVTIDEYAKHLGVHPDSSRHFLEVLVKANGARLLYKAKASEVDRYEVFGIHTMQKKVFKLHDPFGLYERKVQPLNLEWRRGAKIT